MHIVALPAMRKGKGLQPAASSADRRLGRKMLRDARTAAMTASPQHDDSMAKGRFGPETTLTSWVEGGVAAEQRSAVTTQSGVYSRCLARHVNDVDTKYGVACQVDHVRVVGEYNCLPAAPCP